MTDLELLEWALQTIEELDLMGRHSVPGYQMPQEDLAMKNRLSDRVEELREENRE